MVVLSPIMWKILITNTSAPLVGQNKSYWTVVDNVLYMSGTQISIVLTVKKKLLAKPIASSRGAINSLLLHSVESAYDLKQVQPASHYLVIKGWFFFLQPCRNTDNKYICSPGGTEQVPLFRRKQFLHYDGKALSYNPGLQYPHLHGPVHTPDSNRWDTPPV